MLAGEDHFEFLNPHTKWNMLSGDRLALANLNLFFGGWSGAKFLASLMGAVSFFELCVTFD